MGFLFSFLSAFFFACNNILVKKGMKSSENDNGTLTTIVINMLIMGLSLIVYRLAVAQPAFPNITGFLLFALAGFFTTAIGRSLFFAGIRRIGSSRSSAVKNTAPIFTLLYALIFLHEQIGNWPWIGISLIFLGLFLQGYQLFRKNSDDQVNRLGLLLALLAALSFGIGQGVRKDAVLVFPDPIFGAFIGSVVSLIIISGVDARKYRFREIMNRMFLFKNVHFMIAGVATSFAILSFFIAISLIHVAYAGAIAAAEPILTVLFGKIFLKREETISLSVIVSAIVILIGAGIISFTG